MKSALFHVLATIIIIIMTLRVDMVDTMMIIFFRSFHAYCMRFLWWSLKYFVPKISISLHQLYTFSNLRDLIVEL